MLTKTDATLAARDPLIAAAIGRELGRQRDQIELIASENIVSPAVLEAQGSVLTNKYAEGYPGRRYYGGCEFVDEVETEAIERVKRLFGAGFANVQPHSGAQANGAVKLALLQPGDTILGMSLDAGGHLTHGARPAMSGKWFRAVAYGVNEDGRITRELVSGRVLHHERLRDAILRHVEKDLGPMALPRIPLSPQPFTVAEYFPTPGVTPFHDPRQHAVSLAYVVPVAGDCAPQQDALDLAWLTPDEARDPALLADLDRGHDVLLRQALAHLGHPV